eukprot:TRINITY_DN33257_c0_g1_i1.p2 TRINITY_DN33257_c0_g1~~TRINITY_DN33257_c0_g1_i1.p2  ORF type:complete len:334 (+),score=96.20 TRINITY_DN33257_c0_g1_i1:61-1062(+)
MLVVAAVAAAAAVAGSKPYTVRGAIDAGTFENSLLYWKGEMYVLENIFCKYIDHAGNWFPQYRNHSYARIRHFDTGNIVTNISSTIGYGFVSAFPDYANDRVWLFGTPRDRCSGTDQGDFVRSWWSTSADLTEWDTAVAVENISTYNVEVSAVAAPPASLPPHKYVMMLEPFTFMVNDGTNLTQGWTRVDAAKPKAPSGGPSIRWTGNYYYIITGGHIVYLLRSKDLQSWEGPVEMISPTAADAQVAPFCGFPENEVRKGFPVMSANWDHWDWNSNDADVCCMHPDVSSGWLVWGAGTQGRAPKPPVPGFPDCINAVGNSSLKLPDLLPAFFE